MFFASPLLLLALVPWAALSLWLLWGRRQRVPVPFLNLWTGAATRPSRRRAIHPPPVSIVCALAAILLAIIASAGPAWRGGGAGAAEITLLVDRGITMSAGDAPRRFVAMAARVQADLPPAGARIRLEAIPPVNTQETDAAGLVRLVQALPPTAVDTRSRCASAARRALREGSGFVLLLSDHEAGVRDPRFARAIPEAPPANVGIIAIDARGGPRPQVMARLRNDSPATRATLSIDDGFDGVAREIDLPARGGEGNYFVDLKRETDTVAATISAEGDGLDADNRAWLARGRRAARIEPRAPLPPAVGRVIDAYQKTHPAGESAPVIAVVTSADDLPTGVPAAVAAPPDRAAPQAPPVVVAHRLTESLDWQKSLQQARVSPAPASWQALVSADGQALIAVQERPVRRAWIGIDSSSLQRSSDFVMLWANVFDWLVGDATEYSAEEVFPLEGRWVSLTGLPQPAPLPGQWPGLYRRASDGRVLAVNCRAPALDSPATRPAGEAWQLALQRWIDTARRRSAFRLSPWFLLGSLALLLAAVLLWPRAGPAGEVAHP